MSLRRILRRASGILILGISMQYASVLLQGGLRAQTAPKAGDGSGASAQEERKIAANAIRMPLFFEANQGQTDASVRFLTRSSGYTMFLTPTETVLVEGKNGIVSGDKFGKGPTAFRADAKNSKQSVLRMELLGANSVPEFQGLQELPGKVNYLIGKDQASWHTNVALFSEVQVSESLSGSRFAISRRPAADWNTISWWRREQMRGELDSESRARRKLKLTRTAI